MRRCFAFTLVLAVAGGVAGGLVGDRQSQSHTAEASILIDPLEGNPFSPTGSGDELVNLETEAQLVASDAVAELVVKRNQSHADAADILRDLSVTVPPNTQILEITYTSHSRSTAVRRAQGFAEEYLEYRKSRTQSLVDRQTAKIEEQITGREEERRTLVQDLSSAQSQSAAAELLREKIDGVSTQIDQLRARSSELQTGSLEPGQVVTPASAPAPGPIGPVYYMALAGVLAGAALGVGTAFVRSRADTRLHHLDDVDATGLPVLGTVSSADVHAVTQSLSARETGAPTISDDYQRLRARLLGAGERRPVTTMVAAASPTCPSPQSAVGIALSIAMSDFETILIDLSGEPSGLARSLGVDTEPGLGEVLTDQSTLEDCLIQIAPQLHLLQAGTSNVDIEHLLVAPAMDRLLIDLSKRADAVVIASTTVRQPRTLALAGLVDAVLIEATQGHATRRDLTGVHDAVGDRSDAVLGVVYVRDTARTPRGWRPTLAHRA